VTPAEFIAAMPEFSSENEGVITRHIAEATGYPGLDAARWETNYDRGLRYLVAHSIVMEKRRIKMGPVADAGDLTSATTETVGNGTGGRVTKSRSADAVARAADEPLYESAYGKEYLRLWKIVGKGAVAF
jgi:hypothetical protein